MRRHHSQRILVRAAELLLLFAVVGLSTLAKDAKYLPESNPLHHFSKSTKMELVHHPLNFEFSSTPMVSRVVPPNPVFLQGCWFNRKGPHPIELL